MLTPCLAPAAYTMVLKTEPPHAPATSVADHQPAGAPPPPPPAGTRGSGTPSALTVDGSEGSDAHTVAAGS